MKKRDLPKPKYSLGEVVVFNVPSEGNNPPRRDVGRVTQIDISITLDHGNSIRYSFGDHDDSFDETSIVRRVVI
ncbi:hypothetical protein UFOVP558_43 [uncultured Caudovirales phage]|uniref:Uncharacterized protein n=1 Tax=uncultured Caudovirales phage TaxID=2100421 RepID=A0A6J5MSW6_9CAUD|nr:hypothetical protein UFOVP558_43 [uncultured Caudovirales phage]